MRDRVPQDIPAVVAADGDRLNHVAVGQRAGQVAQLAVDPGGDHGTCDHGACDHGAAGAGLAFERRARRRASLDHMLASGEGDAKLLAGHGGLLHVEQNWLPDATGAGAPWGLAVSAERVSGHLDGLDGVVHSIGNAPQGALGGNFLQTEVVRRGRGGARVHVLLQVPGHGRPATDGARGGSIVGLDFDASRAWPAYDWMGVAKAGLESCSPVSRALPGPAGDPGQPGRRGPADDTRRARIRHAGRMAAARRAATWMAWPTEGYTLGDNPDEAYRARHAQVANTIVRHEPVTMVVDPAATGSAHRWLDSAVTVVERPLDDAWMRDIGPTFLTRPARDGKPAGLAAADWIFNGWGAQRWATWDKDAEIAEAVAELAGARRFASPMVNEGGGIHVDGAEKRGCFMTEFVTPDNECPVLTWSF